jgi:hypothetical protein
VGFLKDISSLNKQAKQIQKDWDPAQQMTNGQARLAAITHQMAQANAALTAPPADAVIASAQVVSVGTTSGMVNSEPIVPVEFMIFPPSGPPRPVSTSIVVPVTQLSRLTPGMTVPVKMSASNPHALAVDWTARV